MRIASADLITGGNPVLDTGITGMVILADGDGAMLYTTTGRNGGLAGYRIGADGAVTLHTTVTFPPAIAGLVSDGLILDTSGGGARLFVGGNGDGLIAYTLNGSGGLSGQQSVAWATAHTQAANGGGAVLLEALVTLAPQGPDLLPEGGYAGQIVALRDVTIEARHYLVTICAETHGLTTYQRDPATGALTLVDRFGETEGLGIHAPTGMELVTVGGNTFVVVTAAGTSTLSVMRLGADGRLSPTDHLLDSQSTRFAGAQAVAVAQAGGHAFVVAGGADHGITLFLLTAEGRLVWLDTVIDSQALALHNVASITTAVVGGQLHIFAGSQRDGGITHLTVPIGNLGVTRDGDAARAGRIAGTAGDDILTARANGDTLDGGAGRDVLIAGPGRTEMTGGGGADIFVIRSTSTRAEILDFERGADRLDLTDLPMLRALGQLTVTTTANGARVDYRGISIHIRAADGQPLTAADLFPGGLLPGADRIPVLPREIPPPEPPPPEPPPPPPPPPEPGRRITGTPGDDIITDGTGNDTIVAMGGNDRIELRGGDDLVSADGGDDTVIGAATGNATIYGGAGNDLIYATGGNNEVNGGAGNDTLHGGTGNDQLYGGAGNDLIHTGPGRNSAFGGAGNDTIHCGDGDNHVGGGDGNDLLYGGAGNDTIWGGAGNDTLHGGGGDNMLGGGVGNDVIRGGQGNDTVWGGRGNDLIHGTAGRNALWGGQGNDTIHGGTGDDQIGGSVGNDLLYGGAGNDSIWGGAGNDTLWGGAGNDQLGGGDGDDLIRGEAGDDTIFAGAGNDTVWGGTGADSFYFYRDQNTTRIQDFNPAEGDVLYLGQGLWRGSGPLTPAQVVARFASINAAGDLVLDFQARGGSVIVLTGFTDLEALIAQIEFI